MKDSAKGFTLIELLVVIAIIGVLSSIVLASLNIARAKASDAAIKATVGSARSQALLYYEDNDNLYIDVCLSGANNISAMVSDLFLKGSGAVVCADTGDVWALEAQLVSDPTLYYCADSTGIADISAASSIVEAVDPDDIDDPLDAGDGVYVCNP